MYILGRENNASVLEFFLNLWNRSRNRVVVPARICKRLCSPEIDSEESIRPANVVWRAGTKNRVVVPARQAGNRFLSSLKGLKSRAQAT
jgi:hypothetical protein